MNYIHQLQADKLELNQRLHATQKALSNFKGWYSRKHDTYSFEGLTMLNDIIRESYPNCDTIIEDVPIVNKSGITCACEIDSHHKERLGWEDLGYATGPLQVKERES